MPLWNPFKSKKDELDHEALFAGKGAEFAEAFVNGREKHPIVVKDDGQEAESCDEVCPNMGTCDDCDMGFC